MIAPDDATIRRYLRGDCHCLAWVIAHACQLPIARLQAVRLHPDGHREALSDTVHVFATLPGEPLQVIDIRGIRPLPDMAADFDWLKPLLLTGEGQSIEFQLEHIDAPDDLYCLDGFDSAGLEQAIEDAAQYLAQPCLDAGLPFSIAGLGSQAALLAEDEPPSLLF